jgi:hypothetical protein
VVSVAGSALGPMPIFIARDVFGSCALSLTVSASLPLVLSVCERAHYFSQESHSI